MRRRTKWFIWFVVVAFLAGIFYIWGAGGRLTDDERSIAKVQGSKITERQVETLIRQIQEKNPGADSKQLRQYAFQQLVNRRLLQDAASKLNVVVSDEILKPRVKAYFSSDIQFRQALNSPQVPWGALEEDARQSATLDKIQERIRNGARVTEYELKQTYLEDREERDVKWLTIEIHPSDFEEQTARQKAEDLLKRAKAGEDFSTLARANSDDPGSKDKGGELGLFRKGQMIPEFDKAVFQLKAGEISSLVKTKYGYHIIKAEEVKKEPEPMVNAKHILIALRPGPETMKSLKDKTEGFYQSLSLNQDFDQVAIQATKSGTAKGLRRDMTALAKYEGAGPAVEQAFVLKIGQVSTPVQTEQAFFIVKPVSRKEPNLSDFPPLRKTYLEKALAKKSQDLFQMWFYGLFHHAKIKIYGQKG